MISHLKGNLIAKKTDYFIVDVGGVGFKVNAAQGIISGLPSVGNEVEVFTYLVFRQDYIGLYGFLSQEELSVFEMLLTVSGVGPKLAGTISGTLEPHTFAIAVLAADIPLLTSVKGLGKKGAERIVIELKDKIKKSNIANGHKYPDTIEGNVISSDFLNTKYNEACSALIVLGYTSIDADRAVRKVFDEDTSLENIIKSALKELI